MKQRNLLFLVSILLIGCGVMSCGKDDNNEEPRVIDYGYVPAGVEAVDLGLPSGTKWASCNIGATVPEEYGDYYAWAETETKDRYNGDNYIYALGSGGPFKDLGIVISKTEYDVARAKWGGDWQMPTKRDYQELLENCKYNYTTMKGVRGGRFTSKKNGNSIFLPAAGIQWARGLSHGGENGCYWSGQMYENGKADAIYLSIYKESLVDVRSRIDGCSVRPVIKD